METGTLTDRVYETIKQKILSGEFADGQRLNLTELARQLNVSNSPLREAMSRLEKVGLVRVVPYRGPFVRSMSPAEVAEMFDVRIALETLAARLVAVTASAETLDRLDTICREYELACQKGTDEQVSAADIAFHETIARAAQNQTLIELLQMLSDWTRLFIQLIKYNKTATAPSQGHRRILDAIRAGNKVDAAAAMRQHLLNGKQSVIRRLREQLEPTAAGESPLDFPDAW